MGGRDGWEGVALHLCMWAICGISVRMLLQNLKIKNKKQNRKITHKNFCSTCINVLSSWNNPPRDGIVWSGESNLQGGSCCFHTLRRIRKKKLSFFFFFSTQPSLVSVRQVPELVSLIPERERKRRDLLWSVCQRLSLKKIHCRCCRCFLISLFFFFF